MQRLLKIAIATFLISGCASQNIGPGYTLDPKSKSGVVVGTITYTGGYAAFRLHITGETNESYKIEHGSSQSLNLVRAFKGEEINSALQMRGSPFAVELPEGSYSIRSWEISQGAARVWSTQAPDISFKVEAGKAIYIGNFHFKETNRFGRAITAASVSLQDQSARDLPAIAAAFPSLSAVPLSQSLTPGTNIKDIGGQSGGKITIPIFIPVAR
jgi:hypothetical protein